MINFPGGVGRAYKRSNTMSDETTPVLIVGGGPVGLSAALFLGHQGVSSILVERHPGTSLHPRAKGTNMRTMELFRSLNLEKAIRHAGAFLTESNIWLYVETLAGKELRRVSRRSLFELPENLQQLSPTSWVLCAQNQLEPVLVEAALRQGNDLRFGHKLVSLEQDSTGVTASVKE